MSPARRVLAPNPGPMTLEGTNTWVLGEARCFVVDPGPDDPSHLARVVEEAGDVAEILLTHRHPDHAAGARSLAAMTGAPVRVQGEGLEDGDVLELDGLELRVLATPGHTADHVCFVLPAENAVLTGDHVLGRGTSVVAHPDGRMRDYLDSLRRLADVGATTLLPGHGPVVEDAAERIAYYLAHREERAKQVLDALAQGPATVGDLVQRVYADVDPVLHRAAELSLRAQLDLLVETGRARLEGDEYS